MEYAKALSNKKTSNKMGSNENRRNPAWLNQIETTQTHIPKTTFLRLK